MLYAGMHEMLTCVNFHNPLTYLFIRLKVSPSQHPLNVEEMGYDNEHSSLIVLADMKSYRYKKRSGTVSTDQSG